MKLNELNVNESAVVSEVNTPADMRRRFLDIGLVENTTVKCVGKSPLGDPSAYLIRGAVIAVRAKDAASILISPQGVV